MAQSSSTSDRTDAPWERSVNLRAILDALFYRTKTGGQWRNLPHALPHALPPWGPPPGITASARAGADRSGAGAEAERGDHRPPARDDDGKRGVRGADAGKRGNGRKRHIVVDTRGLILAVVVHAASVPDREGARRVIAERAGRFPRLRLIGADGGSAGPLIGRVKGRWGWTVAIVTRAAGERGFAVLPRRGVGERTFGWLGR